MSSVPDVVDVETDKLFAANIFIFLHRQRHYMRFTQTDRAVRKRSDSDFRAEIYEKLELIQRPVSRQCSLTSGSILNCSVGKSLHDVLSPMVNPCSSVTETSKIH